MIEEADILVLGGGVGKTREALLETYQMAESTRRAVTQGAVALALSDGVAIMSQTSIGGTRSVQITNGLGKIRGGAMIHTEEPKRYNNMLDGVQRGILPTPTYGIPTDVFIHLVDGIPLEAHATSERAWLQSLDPVSSKTAMTTGWHCPVRVDLIDGEIRETARPKPK